MGSAGIALLTGATGFIGSQLVRRLLQEGFAVRAISSGTDRERLAGVDGQVEWFGMSDSDLMLASRGVTQFFNFAVVYDRANFSSDFIHEVNVALPLRIIEALRKNGRPVACVLGDSFYRKFPPEATAQSRYTESKNLLAQRIEALPRDHACRFAMLLIEQVYGPGENLEKAYPRVVRRMLKHAPRVPLTLGDQRRDFIHIIDTVEAACVAGRSKWTGVAQVGCGSGESIPVKTVFERLKILSDSHSELGFGDIPPDQSIPDSTADISWLRSRGWSCAVPLEAGLQDFVTDVARRSVEERT